MENFLISLFSLGLLITILFPFYILKKKSFHRESDEKESFNELQAIRNIELENLQDLKIDLELKKITPTEFQELSMPMIQELEKIDQKLETSEIESKKEEQKPKIKFCYHCGFKLNNHKTCPSCQLPLIIE